MNINNFIPNIKIPDELNQNSPNILRYILARRREVFLGFAELEKSKGLLEPTVSFSSPKGQDSLRLLFARYLEELSESYHSSSRDHYLEELIDALNYLLIMLFLDPESQRFFDQQWDDYFEAGIKRLNYSPPSVRTALPISTLMNTALVDGHSVLTTLRNRSWQNNSQSLYFDGWNKLFLYVLNQTISIINQFSSWEEFMTFYLAKEAVLKFRLSSHY